MKSARISDKKALDHLWLGVMVELEEIVVVQKITGVSATISAAHTSPTGVTHGHTWSVVAWFVADKDAVFLSGALNGVAEIYDHGVLPAELSRGEDMAEHILAELAPIGCFEVEVSRPLEGIFAKARHLETNK